MQSISTTRRLLRAVAQPLVGAAFLIASLSAQAAGFTFHQVQAASSASGSKERNYSFYVPASLEAGSKAPLYVVLHGCRLTERAMTDLAGMEAFAERDKAIILYPYQNNDASSNDNDGRNPNCWGYWLDANIHRDQGEPGDIKRMVDTMKKSYAIDNNRVHVTGISSGGAMATIMQVTYPDVFASAAIVEGIGYSETAATYTGLTDCATVINNNLGSVLPTSNVITNMRNEMKKSVLRQPPVLVMHNKKDCTVPIKVGRAVVDTFLGLLGAEGKAISATPTSSFANSVDGLSYTWSKYGADANGNSLVEYIVHDVTEPQLLNAGVQVLSTDPYDPTGSSDKAVKEDTKRGHWWPGAAKRGPWIINKGINASQAAADFFKSHPMSGGADVGSGDGGTGGGGTGGGGTGSGPTAPTGLAVKSATSSSITLKWSSVSGATGYNVFRNGSKITAAPVSGAEFVDAGLQASTKYSYTVSTVAAAGESKESAAISASTSSVSTTTATCTSASNYKHVYAGRAYVDWATWHVKAKGSNQDMGMWATSLYVITSLKQAASSYYVIGTCQ